MKKSYVFAILIGISFFYYSCSKKEFKVEPENNVLTNSDINSSNSSIVSPEAISLAKSQK